MSEQIPTPERVLIFDTTLRDGVQSPGIALTTEQSLNIAHQLNRLGVDVIEAGFPISSPANFEAVQTIAQEVEGPAIIAGLARAEAPDIEAAAKAIRDAERPRVHTFISTSDIHIKHQMQSTRANVKGLTRAAVAQAKEYVDDVEFSPMDATRADIEFTAEVCQIAIDEGATTINIPDTVGYTEPDEYRSYLERLREFVPALGTAGVVLSVHGHDDLGMAVANAMAGVKAGARQVEVAVNGLGERAGNTSLEEVVMALRTRRDIYGVDTGVDTALLGPTSRMVQRYTGYDVQRNKAIVGKNAFEHESGIHQSAVINERSTFEIMAPEDVGMETGIPLGKQSGRKGLKYVLDCEGVFKGRYLGATFELFKELADKIGAVSPEQAVELHEEAERRQTNLYTLGDYEVSGGSHGKADTYSAHVIVSETGHDGKWVSATNDLEHPSIDGATSALFTAIKDSIGAIKGKATDVELEEFSLVSIGPSEQALGKATVKMRINGKPVTGKGLAFDTMKASGWAYLDAIRQAGEAATV